MSHRWTGVWNSVNVSNSARMGPLNIYKMSSAVDTPPRCLPNSTSYRAPPNEVTGRRRRRRWCCWKTGYCKSMQTMKPELVLRVAMQEISGFTCCTLITQRAGVQPHRPQSPIRTRLLDSQGTHYNPNRPGRWNLSPV